MNKPLKRFERACVICGNTDATQLEEHRVAGITATLCRSCHQQLLERTSLPIRSTWTPPDDLETVGRGLIEEAEFLTKLAQSRWVVGHALVDRVYRDAPDEQDEAQADAEDHHDHGTRE